MKCPGWLLRIVTSFLQERILIFSYKGNITVPKSMPGGAPQGCLLGVVFFAVKFNGALLRPAVERPLSLKNDKDKDNKKDKYMDDTSVAVSIQMDRLLADDLVERHLPLTFSERTGQILPVEITCFNNL